jgi:hypothetical protein
MRGWRAFVVMTALLVASFMPSSPAAAEDCSTKGYGWPLRGHAEGATFLGRSMGSFVNEKHRTVYVFKVRRAYAGAFGSTVRVVLRCVESRLPPGSMFLVSSSASSPRDGGEIHHIHFNDANAVAWRVYRDRTVRLKDYSLDGEMEDAPGYLERPETLAQAVDAVTS